MLTNESEYEEIIAGGKITGTAKAFVSEDTLSDSNYKAKWNDTKSQWDLVSGKSSYEDSKSLGISHNGTGDHGDTGIDFLQKTVLFMDGF